jgi:hypothetical protein
VNWPCGQNPGRKPEGRRRASTREALSLGEQSSTCRASVLCGSRDEVRPLMGRRPAERPRVATVSTPCSTKCSSSRTAAKGSRSSATRHSLPATASQTNRSSTGYLPSSPVTAPSLVSSKGLGNLSIADSGEGDERRGGQRATSMRVGLLLPGLRGAGVQVVTPDAAGDPRGIRAGAVSPSARVPPCRS